MPSNLQEAASKLTPEQQQQLLDAASALKDLVPSSTSASLPLPSSPTPSTAPTPSTPSSTSCTDDDAVAVAQASVLGFTITGCSQVKPFCTQDPRIKLVCCQTCGGSSSSSSSSSSASSTLDPTDSPGLHAAMVSSMLKNLSPDQVKALTSLVSSLDADENGEFNAKDLDRDGDGDVDADDFNASGLLSQITPAQRENLQNAVNSLSSLSTEQAHDLLQTATSSQQGSLSQLQLLQTLQLLRPLGFGSKALSDPEKVKQGLELLSSVFSHPTSSDPTQGALSQAQKLAALAALSKALDSSKSGLKGMLTPQRLADVAGLLGSLHASCSSKEAKECVSAFRDNFGCDFSRGMPTSAVIGASVDCSPFGVCAFEACQANVDCSSGQGSACIDKFVSSNGCSAMKEGPSVFRNSYSSANEATQCARFGSCAIAECADHDESDDLETTDPISVIAPWWNASDSNRKDPPFWARHDGEDRTDISGSGGDGRGVAGKVGRFVSFSVVALVIAGTLGVLYRTRYRKSLGSASVTANGGGRSQDNRYSHFAENEDEPTLDLSIAV
eukprot:g269.t1